MRERLKSSNELNADLSKIGITQLDERTWICGDKLFSRLDWRNLQELEVIGDIQNSAWKFGERNIVPSNILAIIEETGGHLLTALDKNYKQQAFTLTLATDEPQKMFLHMIGVDPNKQSENIGYKLMQLEGAIARNEGVKTIEWTYDPLMGGNSQLYITKLGARPYKYTVNKYGIVKNKDTNAESRYKDVPTDRFTVKWSISEQKTWNIATGNPKDKNFEGVTEWDGEGTVPNIFQVSLPFDFTQLSKEQMMDARLLLRKIALKVMDFDDFSTREYKPGTHEVVAFMKDPNKVANRYIFAKK